MNVTVKGRGAILNSIEEPIQDISEDSEIIEEVESLEIEEPIEEEIAEPMEEVEEIIEPPKPKKKKKKTKKKLRDKITDRLMTNKPWKEWKTRKTTLIFSVVCALTYTITGIILSFFDKSLDSTLTEQVFSFLKWLVLTGCTITIAKVIKGRTNSDCDEREYFDEELE